MNKEEAFVKLFDLLIFYSEERDQPVGENFDFFSEVNNCCDILSLDVEVVKKEFNLY